MTTIAELELQKLQNQVAELEATLEKHRICPVYGVLTRTALEEVWQRQKQIADLAIAFLDVDDLKFANTELGQYEANKRLAEAFSLARKGEVIGRFYYGDEIVILAPATEIFKPCDRILSALKERGMSATVAIVPYRGQESLTDATEEANSLVQACKNVRKGKVYNFLNTIV